MATKSSAPPSSADGKTQNPVAEVAQGLPTNEIQQDAEAGGSKQSHPSVFVNSEPMREDQIQNAVKFLSHPRVKGSPVIHRRSFLERKGLTKEEIDEAFRRVPDPPPSAQAAAANQEGQANSTSNIQPAAAAQTLQPAVAAPPGAISSVGTLARSRFHWYHGVIAVGILAASGAGTVVLIKNAIIPRLKSWIRKVVLEEEDDHVKKSIAKPSLAEEAAAAAKAAAAAASDVAKASQEILISKGEEKRYFEELMNLLDVQVQEMKSLSTAIHSLTGANNNLGRTGYDGQGGLRTSGANTKQTYANGKAEFDMHSVRSSSPPASAEPSVAPHPKSYMEILAMVQRGEKPSNIRDINEPPNPNQQISNPRLAPRPKPWEVGQAQYGSSTVFRSQVNGEGLNYQAKDNGTTYQVDSESIVPSWLRKSPRITEIENEDESKREPYVTQTSEQPIQRTWVPPQPPPVAMPEAAEAIRRPKSSVRKEQVVDDQSASRPTEVADELQRITKVSESGGAVEINVNGSGLISSEIEELQEHS